MLPLTLLITSGCALIFASGAVAQSPVQEAEFTNINPSWSPDGAKLVFESWRDGRGVLYIVHADGTGERPLTRGVVNNTHPHWSPDGTRIVFDSKRDGVWNLHTIRPDGTAEHRLTHSKGDTTTEFARHPAWSPDGKWIAFDSSRDGNGEIYVIRLDGGETRRLTHTAANESHPGWTPDSRVTYSVTVDGEPRTWAADPATGAAGPLFKRSLPWQTGEISPDGRYVLFSSRDGSTPRLYVAPLDGSSPPLALTPEGSTSYEWAWSPDSRRIAFYFDRNGRFDLYTVDVDGRNLRQLTMASRDSGRTR